MTEPPVLVVGAGPTGLTMAVALRRHGIDIRLIDRAPAPAAVSKALAMWSASLEALAGLGVADAFLEEGARLDALVVGDGSRKLASMAVGEGIDSPYPYPLLLPQSRTEAILAARAAELGVVVERGVELTDLAQDPAGVTATLRRPDGAEEAVRCRYLIGADGARSAVRRILDIPFEGYTEPQTFLLGDVEIDGDLDRRSIYIWWQRGGTIALFPFEARTWRVFAVRPHGEDVTPPTLAELQAHVERHGPPGLALHSPTWLSAFRINERLAARYRDGSVFLAGDAAHIHSPAGGQGMNTGIQDAVNLAWKLAHALHGRGDAGLLLDSYEAERRPVARSVVAGAAQKLHVAFAGGLLARIVRDIAAAAVGNLPAVQKLLQAELSETEIVYGDGPLVALGEPPRRAKRTDVGSRARDAAYIDPSTGGIARLWPLLCGPHHTLLLFEEAGQDIALGRNAAHLGAALTVLRLKPEHDPTGSVRRAYRMAGAGWVLVRPDQVIAARGDGGNLAPLANYLDHVLGSRPTT